MESNDMDNPADNLDQTDEDMLTYTVSDDALEAAASIELEQPATLRGYTNPVYACSGCVQR
jgi:hypothetical protein